MPNRKEVEEAADHIEQKLIFNSVDYEALKVLRNAARDKTLWKMSFWMLLALQFIGEIIR